MSGVEFTAKLNGVNSDMDQQLQTTFCCKPDGMLCVKIVETVASQGAFTSPLDGITATPFPRTSDAKVASFTSESGIAIPSSGL